MERPTFAAARAARALARGTFALGLATFVRSWCDLERPIEVGPLRVAPGDVETVLLVTLTAGLAAIALEPGARARVRAAAARLRAQLAAVPPGPRVAWVAIAALLLGQAVPLVSAPALAFRTKARARFAERPEFTFRRSSPHGPHLVDAVAALGDPDEVVVWVEDEDPRPHQASFYCYPTRLVMEPARRAWSERVRQLRYEQPDPGFADPGPAPALARSLAFARARGAPLVVVDARGARVVASADLGDLASGGQP